MGIDGIGACCVGAPDIALHGLERALCEAAERRVRGLLESGDHCA